MRLSDGVGGCAGDGAGDASSDGGDAAEFAFVSGEGGAVDAFVEGGVVGVDVAEDLCELVGLGGEELVGFGGPDAHAVCSFRAEWILRRAFSSRDWTADRLMPRWRAIERSLTPR